MSWGQAMILVSFACALVALGGTLRLYWLSVKLSTIIARRSVRLEAVVRSVQAYREHGTASTWLGVLAQLDRLEACERPPAKP